MEKQFSERRTKLIIGLGNPGPEYENTYHNAGKLMVDYMSEVFASKDSVSASGFRRQSSASCFEISVCGKVSLAKTLTYMNESGKAVKLAMKSLRVNTDSLMIAHDDSDIELGKYKISFGSGPAGHNGVQSVIESIGTKDFWRLRIGIRGANPPSSRLSAGLRRARAGLPAEARRAKAGEFVLKKITAADRELMRSAFEKAYKEIFRYLTLKLIAK
ncbi:MAG: aminoacyl-tRNA hydrolase [bacterium]|nr:aminoacyl-tRNA hydrolase [bacterium]